jgi:adenylate cyclase
MGKTKPVRIFFLLGDDSVASTAAFRALAAVHDAMIASYRRRQWDEALSQLDTSRSQAPEVLQYFYQLYEERIRELRLSPPPIEWDGVYEALTK